MRDRASLLPRVYLAGKIAKNDWRHEVVEGLREAIQDHDDYQSVQIPTEAYFIANRARYTGPFFISDDHGCAHGDSSHGNGPGGCIRVDHRPSAYRVKVAERCKRGIEAADHFFAWLDDLTAYGTLVEVGIAVGLGKRIWLYGPAAEGLDDLWFASHIASEGRLHVAPDPVSAVWDFLEKLTIRAQPLSSL